MADATIAAITDIPFVCSATLQATPQGFDPFKYGGILPMKRESILDQNLPPRAIWLLSTRPTSSRSDGGTGCSHQRTSSKLPIAAAPYKIHTVLTANGKNHGPNGLSPCR